MKKISWLFKNFLPIILICGCLVIVICFFFIFPFKINKYLENEAKLKQEASFRIHQEYRKAHPEKNRDYAILSAKYKVDISIVQKIIESEKQIYNLTDKRDFYSNLSKELNIPEETIASIAFDYDTISSLDDLTSR